jgi:hypothetical protein
MLDESCSMDGGPARYGRALDSFASVSIVKQGDEEWACPPRRGTVEVKRTLGRCRIFFASLRVIDALIAACNFSRRHLGRRQSPTRSFRS